MEDSQPTYEERYISLLQLLNNNRVSRADIFSDGTPSAGSREAADALAALNRYFDIDVNDSLLPSRLKTTPSGTTPQATTVPTEFNLFSNANGPKKVALSDPGFTVPEVKQQRPREYYFTDP